MSKIGKQPIQIPDKVTVNLQDNKLTITGPKGTLEKEIPQILEIKVENNKITIKPRKITSKQTKALWGTWRALIANMITGVSQGFKKILEYEGVGYRATMEGNNLKLALGFSHPIQLTPPEGISFTTEKNTITVEGIDKALVGKVAAKIRGYRPPEPYKGKGIHYKDEVIRRKEGKKSVSAGF
jgi:large subunit ribosomal protein L6